MHDRHARTAIGNSFCEVAIDGYRSCRANDTLAKLQAATHTSSDAARQLPRLTKRSAEANCN
jgi:hypothetical protein